jgi:hypothetical protein
MLGRVRSGVNLPLPFWPETLGLMSSQLQSTYHSLAERGFYLNFPVVRTWEVAKYGPFKLENRDLKWGMVVYSCKLSTQGAEAGGL